jgi:hypothetical protein
MAPWLDRGIRDKQRIIHEEINRLRRTDRAALVLCAVERWPIGQAATALACSAPRLRRRVKRASQLLRARLARRYPDVPAATWDVGILAGLQDAVPERLVKSTVAAAVACHARRLDLNRACGLASCTALGLSGYSATAGRPAAPRGRAASLPPETRLRPIPGAGTDVGQSLHDIG